MTLLPDQLFFIKFTISPPPPHSPLRTITSFKASKKGKHTEIRKVFFTQPSSLVCCFFGAVFCCHFVSLKMSFRVNDQLWLINAMPNALQRDSCFIIVTVENLQSIFSLLLIHSIIMQSISCLFIQLDFDLVINLSLCIIMEYLTAYQFIFLCFSHPPVFRS